MEIVWDEPKRRHYLKTRGLDFAELDIEFFAGSTVFPATGGRHKAVGPFGDSLLTVIFKPLGTEALSVISMRRASKRERKAYDQAN